MLRKWARGRHGELTEPSVVQTTAATVVFGIPNAALGALYYAAVGAAVWIATPPVCTALLVAALCAASLSMYLGYRLLFVVRMPCPFCWTGHVANFALLALLVFRCLKLPFWV
ncbi:MAG: hypothetical protein JO165_13070 [Candidatus Eremiobacteraeota bacterium]|nr:hypothetical protein [Candidatus Eremiobacteraeota bacterium]